MNWFSTSIWVKKGEFDIHPLETVEEALHMLEEWPTETRTPLFYTAVNSLEEAAKGAITAGKARAAVVTFLKEVNCLAEDTLE